MSDKSLKIHVYKGGLKIIEKSGIGKAIFHQIDILKKRGVNVNICSLLRSDIVHFNTIFPDSVFLALLARLFGVKIVYYGHSTMKDFKNSFVGSNFFAPLFKQWIKFCYSLGDIIVTPTEYSKGILEEYGICKPIVALSNGIDADYWGEALEVDNKGADRKRVMSVGHYIERKGIVEFIEAAHNNPDYDFVWYGYTNPGLIPEKVRAAIRTAPDNLKFPGYISSEELKVAYREADLFLFMSHEETEGIVVLEAMASGIPIMVRNIPVYQGWIYDGQNAYVFNNDSEVSAILSRALNSDNSTIVEGAFKTVTTRDYNHIGQQLCETYRKLLA